MVKTHPNEYVVVLQLTVENFKSTLEKSSVVTQAAVDQFYDKWKRSQLDIKEETDVSAMYRMRAIRNWEGMAMRVKKVYHQVRSVARVLSARVQCLVTLQTRQARCLTRLQKVTAGQVDPHIA